MSSINLNICLRPIRFAFLVRPNDKKSILEIFRINTCLWGGKFNPIIPFFKRVPLWWNRKGYGAGNAKQIINGYLDFFEPDFVVEAEKGLADGLGFDPDRVLQLTDLLESKIGRDRRKYGLSVNDLYGDLYKKEFQFTQRHKQNIIHVEAKDSSFTNFIACNFGSFPDQKQFQYFENNYKYVFDPQNISLDAKSLAELYSSEYVSALRVGHAKLKVKYHDTYSDPRLFIFDPKETRDLVDFWNLRIIYSNIVAIPIQWIKELSPFCKKFILDHHHPLPYNQNGIMTRVTSMFSRSIPEDDIEDIHKKYLQVDKEGANVQQVWYPEIRRESSDFMVKMLRATLECESISEEASISGDRQEIHFDSLSPKFANEYGNDIRWANVVKMQDWSHKNQVATIFPTNYKNPSFPKFRLGREHLLPTTEGLVFFPEYLKIPETWALVDGTTALNTWFNDNNISATLSDAGRATQQIIQALGGFLGVRSIAHKGIIELLNKMATKPITRSSHVQKFQNEINSAVGKDSFRNRSFEILVKKKAVELGLELKCDKCSSWSWYSIKQLDYSLTCERCLKEFSFPVTEPTNSTYSTWAYRVIGPFALPDYARGGYSTALTIRFFANVIGSITESEITWSSGQELTLKSGEIAEADFILWHQRKNHFGLDDPTGIVFGEAKSFGKDAFKDSDIDKMKLLAEAFSGSILVFATMKNGEDFSEDEVKRIRKLAEWGREYDKEIQQVRAHIVVLTGLELFADYSLSMVWEKKGGKHKELIVPAYVQVNNLKVLADLTQQLYLDMPSYSDWYEAKRIKRQKLLKK